MGGWYRQIAGGDRWSADILAAVTWFDTALIRPHGEQWFAGAWIDRDWRNVPGPLYTTVSCALRRDRAVTEHAARNSRGTTYLWRQPRDDRELASVVELAHGAPYSEDEFGCDGDRHWTLDKIREWWSHRDAIAAVYRESDVPDLSGYFETELPAFLRAYAFFLLEGRRPRPLESLPEIAVPPRLVIAPAATAFSGPLEFAARAPELLAARGLSHGELPFWGCERESHPLNVPGPFWAAQTASRPKHVAPGNLCSGPHGTFVFRQPGSPRELDLVLEAATQEPLKGLGIARRTESVDYVRWWWRTRREPLRAALEAAGVTGAADYVERELPDYLRGYMFLLEHDRLPRPGEELPAFVRVTPPSFFKFFSDQQH